MNVRYPLSKRPRARRKDALTPADMPRLADYVPTNPVQWFAASAMVVRGPADLADLLSPLRGLPVEEFRAIYLNARHRPVLQRIISVGTMDSCLVHPREVFRPAVELGSVAVIVAHNHPSGLSRPSGDDLELTRRLARVGKLVGIELLDHLVVGDEEITSIREFGWPNDD